MNGLDIVILVIALSLGLIGFMVGLVKMVVTVVGMIIGIFLAGRLNDPMTSLVGNFVSSPDMARLVAFGLVFLVVMIASFIVSSLVKKLLSLMLLGWVDRFGGAAVALFVGMAAVATLLTVLARFPVGGVDKTIHASLFGSFLIDKYGLLLGLLPSQLSKLKGT